LITSLTGRPVRQVACGGAGGVRDGGWSGVLVVAELAGDLAHGIAGVDRGSLRRDHEQDAAGAQVVLAVQGPESQGGQLIGGDIKAPSISRGENGERSVRPTDLRLLLDIYDVQGEQRETLLTLARQAKERGWWQSYASAIPEWFQVYVGLEAEA